MQVRIGIIITTLIILVQWLVVTSFIEHSYTWWLKASDPVITAGYLGTIFMSVLSMAAVAFNLKYYDRLYKEKARLRYLSMLIALAGLAGLLVFFGMVGFGYIILVNR